MFHRDCEAQKLKEMRDKIKNLRSLFALALCVLLTIGAVSCSKDDDEPSKDNLAGTSWKAISSSEDDEDVGFTITLKKDGNVTFSPSAGYNYAKWSVVNEKLRITLGEENVPDDYMEGTFVVNGNTATYTYRWYNADGELHGDEYDVMTLVKV